ncbi:hypothetical protein N0V93_005160 [Gnomoniopsis smithogilvyi]|uniref:ATP-grasp domain-containing protein n=1 Tax=Gnomoniopsis smithogilvyi TaxID=1191159 RepID=A0A9W8YW23_9PEZI|nr:hypothetical protein N0V93_005160 [Gnomoniopsis smithogilvyi]
MCASQTETLPEGATPDPSSQARKLCPKCFADASPSEEPSRNITNTELVPERTFANWLQSITYIPVLIKSGLSQGMASQKRTVVANSPSRPLSEASTAIVAEQPAAEEHDEHLQEDDGDVELAQSLRASTPFLPVLRLPIRDHIKTFLLLYLSLSLLPLSFTIAYLLENLPPSWITYLFPFSKHTPAFFATLRRQCRAAPGFRQRTVLVTGISMTKGLTLARAFRLTGHRVVGADFNVLRSSVWLPEWLGGRRFSKACNAVYHLEKPVYRPDMTQEERASVANKYATDILEIIQEEQVDLWVSCSGVASAAEDGMVRTMLQQRNRPRTECVQFDEETTMKYHEKNTFVRYMEELGLPVPETHEVTSHTEASTILLDNLNSNTGRKFILKPVGMDDAHRGNMTLLPFSKELGTEAYPGADTEAYVNKLPISKERPWILQQFITGNREYCTHALVVDGEVKVFVACPSSELLMHYEALPADHPPSKEMLAFTKQVAKAEKNTGKIPFTGHLSFDFMVEGDVEQQDGKTKMYAIECNPRAHTAVALFATPGAEMRGMVDAYMSVFTKKEKKEPANSEYEKWHLEAIKPPSVVRPPVDATPRYWIGHDLVTLVLLPLSRVVICPFSVFQFIDSIKEFVDHVLWWQDGLFEMWDPWPFVALYHVYWPGAILESWWRGERWSRVNVSTTKMFAC